MAYAVILQPSVSKALDKLPGDVRRRVLDRLEQLKQSPRPAGVEKLTGDENLWRVRVGNWRIVYEIHDRRLIVLVLKVAHRREVYRKKG